MSKFLESKGLGELEYMISFEVYFILCTKEVGFEVASWLYLLLETFVVRAVGSFLKFSWLYCDVTSLCFALTTGIIDFIFKLLPTHIGRDYCSKPLLIFFCAFKPFAPYESLMDFNAD